MFKDPERVLDQFILQSERTIADFGAGSGAYTFAAARRVGSGKVYAIEVQRDLLQKIKNTAHTAHLSNVEVIWGDVEKAEGSGLAKDAVDAVIISNILFQAEDKSAIAREAYRILKNGGRALVIDWSDTSVLGPTREYLVPKSDVRHIFESNQLVFEREIDAGRHHYGLVFRKK